MAPIRIGIVGIGKIARDQHLPVIGGDQAFKLSAIATRSGADADVPTFPTLEAMLDGAEVDAVALCTPPQVRHKLALAALRHGRHVLLEKPPGATLSEVEQLAALADKTGRTLFATWHSRFAPGVEPARRWLADKAIRSVHIAWKEDVRRWHPGQTWIWEPGGLGVFDPGINALSIATRILPQPFFLTRSALSFPENCRAPIAASLAFSDADGTPITAEFDFRQRGGEIWDIEVATDAGRLTLSKGGAVMAIDGKVTSQEKSREYAGLYARFRELIDQGKSEVDVSPLRHVADAFMLGRIERVAAFYDNTSTEKAYA
jgi:D-galactose 1-dehydrogenase